MNNAFLQFVRKESLHILRDWRTMLIVLIVPIMLMMLFGFTISTEVNEVNVAVVMLDDESGQSLAQRPTIMRIVEAFENNPYFLFHGFIRESEVDSYLRSGKCQAVVLFARNYERLTANGEGPTTKIVLDGADTNMAQFATMYLQQTIAGAVSPQDVSLQGGTEGGLNLFASYMRHNPQLRSSYNFVPGVMGLVFLLICAMMTSVSIVREKEVGTMEVLLVSPVRPFMIVIAKMIPYFVLSCINLATILLLARYALDIPMSGGMGGVIAISLLYLVLALSLGLLISTIAQTQMVALLVSAVVMMMPVMMFSGMMYPIENLPLVLKPIPYIVPARWYIDAMRQLMIEGVPFYMVLKQFLVLLGMTVLILTVALKKFNDKL